jgi:hypothetical protein
LSNSHSGALLARIDRSTLGGSGRGTGIGGLGVGDVATAAGLVVLLAALVTGSLLGDGLGVLLVLVHGPIEDVVILESLTDEEIAEDLAQVRVVRLVVEAQGAGVVEVDGELIGEATAEDLGRRRHLLLHDAVVLLLLGRRLEALPREGSTAEVEHDVA